MRFLAVRWVVLLGLAGCVVMRPPRVDERPRWQVTADKELDAGCVIARALVRKSGKQGIGMALQLKSRGDCEVRFTAARLQFADGTQVAVPPPPVTVLPGRSLVYVWWPIAFNNNVVWNEGRNAGELELDYAIGDATGAWQLAMVQR